MRKILTVLLLFSVLLFTACSNDGVTSEDTESGDENSNVSNNEESCEGNSENSTDENLIVLHSDIIDLPYLTITTDHNWEHNNLSNLSFDTRKHPNPTADRGLEEIVFDGMPTAEQLPEDLPSFPDELEIINSCQEKNGLYITLAGYGDYFFEYWTSCESNGYTLESDDIPGFFYIYYNAETDDYFYYNIIWASTEHFEYGRQFVIDLLIINN